MNPKHLQSKLSAGDRPIACANAGFIVKPHAAYRQQGLQSTSKDACSNQIMHSSHKENGGLIPRVDLVKPQMRNGVLKVFVETGEDFDVELFER